MQEVIQVYSVMLMMAMTTGGDAANLGRHGCCGESAHCGRSHGGGHSGCGYSGGCGTGGYSGGCGTGGCGTGGYGGGYSGGCATCLNGACSTTIAMSDSAPATLVVSLPADAVLTIDDQPTTSTSDHRVFVSPNLTTGKDYSYTLKAEVSVNGQSTVVSKVVTVRAGEETQVTLTTPTGVAER